MISSSQRPLPDNTRHSQQKNIHAPGGIRTYDPSRRAAADLRPRPRGYWDRQQEATIQVNLLFLVSSTCFGRCFRPSSGALDCIYSIWQYSPKWPPAGVLLSWNAVLHVSGDVFARHQEPLTVFTVSGSIHPSGYQLVSC